MNRATSILSSSSRIPAICPVRREQQAWKVGIQPGGPWPRRLEAEIRIVGHEVVLVAIVELDFPGPILVLRSHYAGEPCAGISWFLGIFEEAFYPSPFSDFWSACGQDLALVQTTLASKHKAQRAFNYQFGSQTTSHAATARGNSGPCLRS